ncbi:hypothetical protein OS493_025160 [Desmophyllum pertusum]|uniref:Uncharacterized protein n=1 Tax=Desmophyllum pertusum TaxID=174260 RepID=A0A9X0A2K8_9CNID|nr:hypothetical protein OS493_025160 [Desmophyllum pertusum]
MELLEQEAEQLDEIKEREDGDFPADKRRKVRWSVELEEVHYFVPLPQPTEGRWKRKMKCLREKALDLKHKPILLLWDFYDSNTVHLFHSGLEFLARKVNGRSDKINFEDIHDINKPWDDLFELYTSRGEDSYEHEGISPENRSADERIESFA